MLPLIGIQGNDKLYDGDNDTSLIYTECAGLLLARTYAISNHKKLVLAILGALGMCAIILTLVCSMSILSVNMA